MYKSVYFHKTVQSAEVMLLRSIMLADEQLNLTDKTLDNYLNLTDEIILEQMCLLGSSNKSAAGLAGDYKSRKLLKCVYEKFLHSHDNLNRKMNTRTLYNLESQITEVAHIKEENTIFVDASSASSMPKTPTKEEISSILLVEKEHEYETPVTEIPLIASITGSLDMLRVYTTVENRNAVEKVLRKCLVTKNHHIGRTLWNTTIIIIQEKRK